VSEMPGRDMDTGPEMPQEGMEQQQPMGGMQPPAQMPPMGMPQ
jgi:hypothetical protein